MTFGMDSRILFGGILFLVVCERIVELFLSTRNARRVLAGGGIEVGAGHYRWMVLVHTAFLLSCVVEVWVLGPPFIPPLGSTMMALLVGAMVLRYWAVVTLGDRWNTRVIVMPGTPPIQGGPYRWVRHPNYLAVIVELAALPLIHTAWITALLFGSINALILKVRIRVEEEALSRCSGYERVFSRKGRLLPRRRRGQDR